MCIFAAMKRNEEKIDMYKGLASYFLPDGVLEYFDVADFCEEPAHSSDGNIMYTKELHIYLDEKDNRPEGFPGIKSNGYTEPLHILDFPARTKKTILHIRRRRWLTAENKSMRVPLEEQAKVAYPGTRYSKEMAIFLKVADGH